MPSTFQTANALSSHLSEAKASEVQLCTYICLITHEQDVGSPTGFSWFSGQTRHVRMSENCTVILPFGVMRVTVPSPNSSCMTWPPRRRRPSMPPITARTAMSPPTSEFSESGKKSSNTAYRDSRQQP